MNNQSNDNSENIGQQMSQMANRASDQVRQTADKMTSSIVDNPMTSVLWAGLIGFMLGVMTKR
jgi:ElaB/YqjD/DUF883 family membrane-anchored ribosome-binding protein